MITAVMMLLIVIDQITKSLAIHYLKPIKTFELIENILSLTYVENRGAAFGMLQNARWLFIIITIAVLVGLWIYIRKTKPQSKLFKWSAAIIAAGAFGNLFDRVEKGYVVDMIEASFIDFPVFNFADCCVVVGTVLLCTHILIKKD